MTSPDCSREPPRGDITFIDVNIFATPSWGELLLPPKTSPWCASCRRPLSWSPVRAPWSPVRFCSECRDRGRPFDSLDPDDVGGSG